MKKTLIYLLLMVLIACSALAYTDDQINDTITDPDSFTNTNNAFDNNVSTYAQKTATNVGSISYELGKTWTTARYLNNVTYKASIVGNAGTANSDGYINIQYYDGSTWSNLTTYHSEFPATTYNVDASYDINNDIYGLRIQGWFYDTDNDRTADFRVYELSYIWDGEVVDSLASRYPLNDTNPGVNESAGVDDNWGTNDGQYYGRTFNPGTITGATYANCTNTSSTCLDFDGDGDYVNLGDDNRVEGLDEISISFIFKIANTNNNSDFINKGRYYDNTATFGINRQASSNRLGFSINNDAYAFATPSILNDTWYNLIITYSNISDSFKMYLNGALIKNGLTGGTFVSIPNTAKSLLIGSSDNLDYLNGSIDEVTIYNRSLSSDEVLALYNNNGKPVTNDGLVAYYDFDEGSGSTAYDQNHLVYSTQFNKTIGFDGIDDYILVNDDATIQNLFSGGGSISVWYKGQNLSSSNSDVIVAKNGATTLSGYQLYLDSDNGTEIAFASAFSGGINQWYTNTSNIVKDTWYHIVINYNKDSVNNNPDIYINKQLHDIYLPFGRTTGTPNSDAGSDMYIGDREYQAMGNPSLNGTLARLRIYNRSLEDYEIDYLYYQGLGLNTGSINITATDINNGTSIDNFDIIATGSDNSTYNFSTTNGYIYATLPADTYTMVINSTGYAYNSTSTIQTISAETLYYLNYQLYTTNSITFYIYDEETNQIINWTNMTVEAVGSSTKTGTTTNGTLYLDLFTPGTYEARYYSTSVNDYTLRSKFFTILNNTYHIVNLYALNESSTATNDVSVIFRVIDQNYEVYEGAYVVVSRWYSSPGAFVDIWNRYTNVNGEASGKFIDTDAFYQYRVLIDGTVKYISTSSGTQFIDSDGDGVIRFDIFINTADSFTEINNNLNNVSYNLRFVNTSNISGYFELTGSYESAVNFCLKVINNSITQYEHQESCVLSDNPTIQISVNSSGNMKLYTGIASVQFNTGETKHVLDTLTISLGKSYASTQQIFKSNAIYIILLLSLVSGIIFIGSPKFAMIFQAIVLLGVAFIDFTLIYITIGTSVLILLVAIVLGGLIKKGED